MRTIPSLMQAVLDAGATTLARCWRVTRRDGAVLGFTDHDRDLAFDGVTYEAASGVNAGAVETATGLSADSHEIAGALASTRIEADDVTAGRYTGAEIALFLVDWTDIDQRVQLSRGVIGEIRRGESAFEAEIVGLTDLLNQPTGRAYLHSCDCRLGDTKCGVDLDLPEYLGTGTVAALGEAQFTAAGLGAFAPGWFSNGGLRWLTGANAGLDSQVKTHLAGAGEAVIELWLAPPFVIAEGDTFEVRAGCDKTAETCRAKFDNILEFRGFPHMPGDDFASTYPNSGERHDGGSLFRS